MGPAPRPSRDPGGTHSLNQSIIELTTDTVFRPILCDTIMQLLNAYSKPLLLYGIEAVNPNRRLVNDLSDLPCDLPCAASLAGIQPVRPRAQRTSP